MTIDLNMGSWCKIAPPLVICSHYTYFWCSTYNTAGLAKFISGLVFSQATIFTLFTVFFLWIKPVSYVLPCLFVPNFYEYFCNCTVVITMSRHQWNHLLVYVTPRHQCNRIVVNVTSRHQCNRIVINVTPRHQCNCNSTAPM